MIRKLIYCPACNETIPNYQGSEVTRAQDFPGVEWSGGDLAGAREFLRGHFGHKLEELEVEEGSWISEKPPQEPVRISYCFARKKGRRYLLRRTRSALNRAASYEIVPGRIEISTLSLKIQEDDLRRQIFSEEDLSPSLKGNAEKFIQVFRDEVEKIPSEKAEEETGEIGTGESVALDYVALGTLHWEKILSRCRLYFSKADLEALRRFIDENRHPPDVLSVKIERRISILPLAGEDSMADDQKKIETEEEPEIPSVAISKKKL